MNRLISILILGVFFWSIAMTFRAIYLIVTNSFNGSKAKWIIISMIGIIGPILWITKGKKLLRNDNKNKINH